jgi:hypothetical protein
VAGWVRTAARALAVPDEIVTRSVATATTAFIPLNMLVNLAGSAVIARWHPSSLLN